ncbi:MAG: sigma-70 family RNA polymerase sigma factor [Planctomycetales bacterium]|nr:sigma-70 family RNA polymerase sigma factor [Planctomycetales bacterium]
MLPAESSVNEALIKLHGEAVWRLIVRILGNDGHDAADCFQQAFVELVGRQRRHGDVRDAGGLLRRIAAARAVDCVRRRIRQRARIDDVDPLGLPARSANDPHATAEGSELVNDLRTALTRLSARQAEAFVLVEVECLTREQAALALGVSANHVAVLLHRARAALREHLASHHASSETPS